MFKNKYRAVTDRYCGFEAQVKFWWFPFIWWQISTTGTGLGVNTYSTLERASDLCRLHAAGGGIYKVEV